MNDNIAKLLEQLAKQLGTTVEYLWTVLIKQAPIAATTTLIQTAVIIGYGIALLKVHKRLLRKTEDGGDLYEKYELGAVLPMVIASIVFVILLVWSIAAIDDVINGYFNPEYWALKKVLNLLKEK